MTSLLRRETLPVVLDIPDPVPLLQVFAIQYRSGRISASSHATRKHHVEEALHAIGQTQAGLGLPNPRLAHFSDKLDFRLRRQLATFQRLDSAPNGVKPIPLPVLIFATAAATQRLAVIGPVLADMLIIAFFSFYGLENTSTLLPKKPLLSVSKTYISFVDPPS